MRFLVGDAIWFLPRHAHGDAGHPDNRRGIIAAIDPDGTHWVKFEAAIARMGFDIAPATGTDAQSLRMRST